MIIDDQGRRDYGSQPDGWILQAVGGASGNLKLINGQTITFPWKAQEEITGAQPPAIQTQEFTGLTHLLWSTYTGGEFPTVHDRAPYLRFISSFPDASSHSAIADLASGQVAGNAEALIRLTSAPTAGQIYLFGETIMIDPLDVNVINTLDTLDIEAGGVISISTTGAGDDIVVTAGGEVAINSGSGEVVTINAGNDRAVRANSYPIAPIRAVDAGLVGTPPAVTAAAPGYKIIAGKQVISTTGGVGTLTFPVAFANGLLSLVCQGTNTDLVVAVNLGAVSVSSVGLVLSQAGTPATGTYTVSYIAIGW